ncbi:MAG: HAD family hydrolase [Desulforhabdus sp.]|jgi:HAD superfamily hydrolase (TIGR01549 family)|nr:HAD family hydrolase [Desulforhabdus sp.]
MEGKPKAVFFDIGHTLVEGSQPSARRLLAARMAFSEKETKRAGRFIMVHPATNPYGLAEALAEILPNQSLSKIVTNLESLWEEQINCVTEIPGATRLLRSLKDNGIRLGVLSNIWHPFYEGFCRNCREILGLLDYTVLSYRVGCKKPSLQFFRHALAQADLPAHSCCVVGDSYELDMAPALQLGMRTVWLFKHPEKEKAAIAAMLRGEKALPHSVAENLEQVLHYLKEMEK